MRKYLFYLIAFVPFLGFGQLLNETFEGGIPSSWTVQQSNPNETWTTAVGGAGWSGNVATVEYDAALGQQDEWLISPTLDLSSATSATLNFNLGMSYYWGVDPNNNYDALVKISSDNGATWTQIWSEDALGVFTNWTPNAVSLDILSYASATVKIAFQYYGADGAAVYLDDIEVLLDEGGGEPTEWSCDLEAELADPALGGLVWDRVTATGTVPAFGGTGVAYHVYGPFTVDVDGSYVFYSDQSYDTADEWDGLLLLYHTSFDPEDGTVNFVAGNDDAAGTGVGTSSFTTNLTQGIEYFLVTTGYASDDFGAFVNTITGDGTVTCGEVVNPTEGCLEADNGQYPGATYVPSCNGAPEVITSAGWTGEYSMVTVTSGEEYIFSVSDPTYFITIGNEAGDAVITSGTGSVTWTADMSGNVRFYTHFTSACDFDATTFLSRSVQCGEPPVEPDYGCDQSYDGEYYLANSVSSDLGYTVANDFFAPGDADAYVINSITAALLPIAGSDADFSTFDVSIHSDNAGTPGAVLETFAGLTATSVTLRSELFAGYNNYDVTLTIPDYEVPVTAGTDTRYWVSIAAASASAQNIFWIGYPHTTGWVTATNYQSADGGTTWNQIIDEDTPGMFFDSIWSIDATCEEVIVEGCLDAPYGQYPSGAAFVPECQGEPETITEAAWTGEYSLVTVTAATEYIFSSSVETDFVTISNADGTVVLAAGVTPLTWTADAGQDVRFYLHLDAECNSINEGLRSRIVQCGEFTPPTDYCEPMLDCTDGDVITNVTFAGIVNDTDCSPNGYGDYTEMQATVEAGETYAMSVTVGAGWDFESTMVWIDFNNDFIFDPATEYFFIGSDAGATNTADITIPAGTPDGEYRLRVRVGAVNPDLNDLSLLACDEETVYGETEDYTLVVGESTGEPCGEEVESNSLENGLFLGGANNQRLAVDIIVDANTEFTLETVEPTILVPEGSEATSFSFIFYEDLGGLPGAELGQSTGTIVSSTVTGQNFGRDFIRYEVSLATPMVMETGTYWMEMVSDAEGWEATTASVIGSTLVFSNASTTDEWVVDGTGTELVYELIGTCTTLGVSDMDAFDFAYYPNPVKDELNITSQKLVQSVSVYNLAGQQVSAQKLNAVNGKISTSSLAPGVYVFRAVLEGGQVETFKVIKK